MSCMICSQCGGSGKSARKGKLERKACRRCHGSGKSPDPNTEKELAMFMSTKRGAIITPKVHNVSDTGSFKSHK